MRQFFIIVFIFTYAFGFTQSKWETSVELDFVFPNKKNYFYNDENNRIIDTEIKDDGFLLNSFGIQGNYNYLLFKKLSIGILGGLQTLSKPSLLMLKLGGILKYYFVDRDNVYIYLQDANNFTLNKEKFKSGNNLRLGLGFPFIKRDNFDIIGNLFFEQNYFKLDGSEPLLGSVSERPRSLTVKSIGISLGVKF
jgi:hypothetical protein